MKKAAVIFKPGFSTDVVIFFCGFLWHHFCVFGFLYFGCNVPKFWGGVFCLTHLLLLLSVLFFVLGVTGICGLVFVVVTQACLVIFTSAIPRDICVTGVLLGWSFWDINSGDLSAWPWGYVYHVLGIVVPDTSDTSDYCVFFIFVFLIFDLSSLSQYYFNEQIKILSHLCGTK